MAETPDQIWLHRIAHGDELAFRSLYDHYAGKVYAMAWSWLKSPLEAQDAVQEIFLKLWEKKTDLSNINNIGAWLHVLTRNHLINQLQKKVPVIAGDDFSDAWQAEKSQHPAKLLDLKEMTSLIREAVNKLPNRQQQVYRMSREQGLSLQEIAQTLGISYNTVREHMSYALKNIRQHLGNHYGEYVFLIWILVR